MGGDSLPRRHLRAAVCQTPTISIIEVTGGRLAGTTFAVQAAVKVLDQTTDGTVTLRPQLAGGGKLRIEVVNTNLGTIQLPGLDETIAQQINERLHSLLRDLPVVVTGVSVDPVRGLTVTCQVDLQQLESATYQADS